MKKLIPTLILLACLCGNVLVSGNAQAGTVSETEPCIDPFTDGEAFRHKIANDEQYNATLMVFSLFRYCDVKEADDISKELSKREKYLRKTIISQCDEKEYDKAFANKLFAHLSSNYRDGYRIATFQQYDLLKGMEKATHEDFCLIYISGVGDGLKEGREDAK